MRERAQAEEIVVITHQNERIRPRNAGGERAHPFAFVWIDIDPALLQNAVPQYANIVLAERPQPLYNPFDSLFERDLGFRRRQRRSLVVNVQFVVAERASSNVPIAMPSREVLTKSLN